MLVLGAFLGLSKERVFSLIENRVYL